MAVDSRPTVGRQNIAWWSTRRPTLDRQRECRVSVKYRPSVGGISVKCQWSIGRVSVVYRYRLFFLSDVKSCMEFTDNCSAAENEAFFNMRSAKLANS